jgi:glycosyltransferase involved in cell wall biosynthesis
MTSSTRPLVSVVLPAHNRERVLADAIGSVRQQTMSDWELIVVDDASDDGTAAIAEEFAREDARIQVRRHPINRGAQAARNTGIRVARGDWISFLDSDDEYFPYSLEDRIAAAAETKMDVVHSECIAVEHGDNERLFGIPPLNGNVYAALLERPGPAFPALLVKRHLIMRLGGLDERIAAYQEWETSIRLARLAPFAYVSRPTFRYDRRTPRAISRSVRREAYGYRQVVDKHRLAIVRTLGPHTLSKHYRHVAEPNGTWRLTIDAQRLAR